MTTTGLTKICLSALGRNPLPGFPEVTLYLQHETSPLRFPALICGASLTATPDHERNFTSDFNLTFTLIIPADDYATEKVEAISDAVSTRLYFQLTDIDNLNAHAEEISAKSFFYSIRWAGTDEFRADEDRNLSQTFTFTGNAQF